jgi:hypothetical protein
MAGLGEQINIIDEGGMLAGAPIVGVVSGTALGVPSNNGGIPT